MQFKCQDLRSYPLDKAYLHRVGIRRKIIATFVLPVKLPLIPRWALSKTIDLPHR